MPTPWYRNAIIYGIDVARYCDGNGDGVGDFEGLTGKVPYLADLGVTCVWLLPCFPNSQRDNGYDITDYYRVDPRLGTLEDLIAFIHRAGEHGIRVVLDLVGNHTSDRHPWFQAARHDPESRFRDYYVWSHNPPPTPAGQGSIFPGEESSVWTYDDVARAYYHHRFYSFEPELNIANREVQDELLRVVDHWLSFGISGFRLDAASHLVEEQATQTAPTKDPMHVLNRFHDFLRSRRPDAVFLAEADEPPGQLGPYFGDGGRLDILLNFVLNNYVFLAFAREDAGPILKALKLLPATADGQWANFLRNLDELDLERLDEDERAEVMAAFAPEDGMKIFGRGIRRRLAPMLDGDPRRLKLAFSLLLSLPGTPLFVYGDEIGMGDDLSRDGREAVRLPMQWSDDPNGGFSTADPAHAALAKGEFGYRRVNVARQQGKDGSLLEAVKALIRLRHAHPEIGMRPCDPMPIEPGCVLAQAYQSADGSLLMLHNLSGRACRVEVPVEGRQAVDLIAAGEPAALAGPLKADLPPYGYRWLRIER